MEGQSHLRVLTQLIERLTDKKHADLDTDVLRRLKKLCKGVGDTAIKTCFMLLMEKIREQHARTRLLAVHLASELFARSGIFRILTATNITEFLEHTVGFRQSKPLPDPPQDAKELREAALESLETWNEDFGANIPQIRMAYSYIKNVLKFRFPELRNQEAQREAEAAVREARSREINAEKYTRIKNTYIPTLADIESTLDEMEASFRLLEGRADPLPAGGDDEDWEDVAASRDNQDEDAASQDSQERDEAQQKSFVPITEAQSLELKNQDPALIEALRGNYKLLVNRQLPTVLEWLRVVIRVDAGEPGASDHARKERILRAAIKTRDRIGSVKTHCETLMSRVQDQDLKEPAAQEALVINTATGDGQTTVQVHRSGDAESKEAKRQAKGHPAKQPGKRKPPSKTSEKQNLLEDVFGTDSDDESPPVRQKKPAAQARSPAAVQQPPKYLDPTYRRPETAVADSAAASPSMKTLSSKDIQKSKLPEDIKQKLLVEAPALPSGTHLAYWDSDKASLLNNKGMEVYNHWGAVDENIQLPEHVISQFFTTRASYYDPSKKELKRPREEAPAEPLSEPPRKRPPKVTPIGLGAAATNKLSIPTLPLVPAKALSAHKNTSGSTSKGAMLPPSRVGQNPPKNPVASITEPAVARADEQIDHSTPDTTAQLRDAGLTAPAPSSDLDQPARDTPREGGFRGRGDSRGGRASQRGAGRGRNTERGTANQRAQDKAHNDAILAQAADGGAGTVESTHEASNSGKRGGKKPKPSVRERLAAKLLTGGARDRAVSEVDAVENERIRDADSHRW